MSRVNFVSPEILEPTSDWVLIGRGHFGDVFKTKHKGLHLHVAVKQLKDPSCCLEELLDEAQKIKHASDNYYVIQVLGIMKAPPCIVMQWMEYGCLGTLMERVSGIPWPFKYRILHEVALGMNWLHSLSPPLLHLDLKPRNVLLNEALHIRIADFGLSRFSSTALDDTKPVGGTWAYMPPEAFEEGYKPSKSTDIYSFAILSAVVLNGDDPYPVDVSSLIRISIKEGQRPTFESLEDKKNSVKNLDKAIAFTKRCWDNDKQKRPSFGECCNKWEIIKSAYTEKEIKHAVKTVQNMMDCTDSASSAPDVQQSASVPNTKDMSDIINKMKTIHIAEQPSAKQEAACSVERCQPVQRLPPANQPRANVAYNGPHSSYIRTGTQPIRNPQSIPNQRGWPQEQVHLPRPVLRGQSQPNYRGPDHRTNSSYYYKTGNFRYPPTVQRPYMNTARQPYQPRTPSNFPGFEVFETPFFKPGIQSPMPQNIYDFQVPQQPQNASVFNIAINNNTGPFQIGDNCDMSIGVPRQRQNTNQSGWTRPPSGPKPTQFSNIQMSGNTGPVQIGDNNSMYLEDSNQYIGSNIYSSPQHPVQTASSRSFVPANIVQNPQPMRSSQVSLPTEDGGPLSYTGHPTPETGRQTVQPAERPTIQDTTVSNSLEAKEKDHMSSVNSPSAQ